VEQFAVTNLRWPDVGLFVSRPTKFLAHWSIDVENLCRAVSNFSSRHISAAK
jgi:hypothetical protein